MLASVARPWVARRSESATFRGIVDGTLDDRVMRTWVEQDFLYLQVYGRVLARLAWSAPDRHIATIIEVAHDAIGREVDQIRALGQLFDAELDACSMNAACRAYTDYLIEHSADYQHGIVAVAPCMIGFAAIGITLERPDEPRYRRWIDTYSVGDFQQTTRRFGSVVDDLDLDDATAVAIFEDGMRHEAAMWRGAGGD
ncbi:MAG: hypothetical protein RIB65_13680 [Ilumatobacter fluminis]|uniref:TenA family protein n=1 Tax=Ilumatobacter fluminis TaxID=467091 RepID=UPI0032EFFF77